MFSGLATQNGETVSVDIIRAVGRRTVPIWTLAKVRSNFLRNVKEPNHPCDPLLCFSLQERRLIFHSGLTFTWTGERPYPLFSLFQKLRGLKV